MSRPQRLRFIVLGLLRDGHPKHGYGLMKASEERTGYRVSTAGIYPVLHEMMGEGLVERVPTPRDHDPRRAPYRITDGGARAFDEWLVADDELARGRVEQAIADRAVFLTEAPPHVAWRLLEAWRDRLQATTARLSRS